MTFACVHKHCAHISLAPSLKACLYLRVHMCVFLSSPPILSGPRVVGGSGPLSFSGTF